jgi:hypothetical protein
LENKRAEQVLPGNWGVEVTGKRPKQYIHMWVNVKTIK